jgi:hypothetical protein
MSGGVGAADLSRAGYALLYVAFSLNFSLTCTLLPGAYNITQHSNSADAIIAMRAVLHGQPYSGSIKNGYTQSAG